MNSIFWKYIYATIFSLILLSIKTPIQSYEPPTGIKPQTETYKFIETPVRQGVTKFLKAQLYISSHCVIKKGGSYSRRDCGAWIPLDLIETGEYKKLFTPDKIWPDVTKPKAIALYICIRSGGFINSEVNEFGRYGRGDTMDFCQYPDTSLVSLLTIEYLLRTTSSQKQKPETKQPVSEIKKEDAEKRK